MRPLLLVSLVLWVGCTGSPPPAADPQPAAATPAVAPLDVRALSFPAGWLARRIGGDRVQVTEVTPPGEDPPFWQPTGEVVAGLGGAALIVANGAGYEAWITTASLPAGRLVSTADGLDLVTVEGTTHSHGKAGAHSHAGTDPHTWADPRLFARQGERVHAALLAADPAGKDVYDANLAALRHDLETLATSLGTALDPARGRKLAASHPAYNYLARAYGLDLRSFGLDPAEPPAADALAEVAAWAADAGPDPVLLWEAPPAPAVTAALPAGIRHVVVDNLEQPPDGGAYDYLAQARANLDVLRTLASPAINPTPAP